MIDPIVATIPGFNRVFLKNTPYPEQEAVLWDLDNPKGCFTSVCANNGSGKTEQIGAPAVLGFASLNPNSLIVTTSATHRQVEEQQWKNINKYRGLFKDAHFTNTSFKLPNGSEAIGFSTDDPGKFEGWHRRGSAPLLFWVDEAKTVPDKIFTAIDRCQPTHILLTSSAGLKSGHFYNTHTNPRLGYKTKIITWKDCPHITQDYYNKMVAKYGTEQHAWIRSSFYSEFMGSEGDCYIVTMNDIEQLLAHPPLEMLGKRLAYIDWSAGGDETVIAIMSGNKLLPLIAWTNSDTNYSVGRAIRTLTEYGLKPEDVTCDAGGVGNPMYKSMAEAGWTITGINNQSTPYDPNFINRGGEMWHDCAYMIKNNKIILCHDPLLFEQLTSRMVRYDSKGRLGAETKEDMAERGLNSPDRGDAASGVISAFKWFYMHNLYDINYDPLQDRLNQMFEQQAEQYKGFNSGL